MECMLETVFRARAQVNLLLSATAHCLPKQVSIVITFWCESFTADQGMQKREQRFTCTSTESGAHGVLGVLGMRKHAVFEH